MTFEKSIIRIHIIRKRKNNYNTVHVGNGKGVYR